MFELISKVLTAVTHALGLADRFPRLRVDAWQSIAMVPGVEGGVPEWWGITVANLGKANVQIVGWDVRVGSLSLGKSSHVGHPPSITPAAPMSAMLSVLGETTLVGLPVTIPPKEQRSIGSIRHDALVDVVRPWLAVGVEKVPVAWVTTGTGRRHRGIEMPPHRSIDRSRLRRLWCRIGPARSATGGVNVAPAQLP